MGARDLDLNCDLGEGESPDLTRELFPLLSSVNVACGGHAGDESSMRDCIEQARIYGLRLGAHPGWPGEFGRGRATVAPAQLAALVAEQGLRLARLADRAAVPLQHVKLHGTLYHLSESTPELASAYLEVVRTVFPGRRIYCVVGGWVEALAAKAGVEVWPEAFGDRSYQANGKLVPRTQAGALLSDPETVAARVRTLVEAGQLQANDGTWLSVPAKTLCYHADTPNVKAFLTIASRILSVREGGIQQTFNNKPTILFRQN